MEETNHTRFLKLKEEVSSSKKQIKIKRNKRRNFRKKCKKG